TPPYLPPTPDPCDGNTAPVIIEVTLDGEPITEGPVNLTVGTSYTFCVEATDTDLILTDLTYTFTVTPEGGVPVVYGMGTNNCYVFEPSCLEIGTYTISVEVSDGCKPPTPWGPITVIVCPLQPYLEIVIDDSNPCSNTCATITSVEWWDGDCLIETFVPPYDAYPGLSWIVDSGISFDPTDGTVCLTDVEIGTDYVVDFTYEDECGGTATGTAIVNFKEGPTAEAGGPYEGSAGTTVDVGLDGSGSYPGDAPISTYDWDFGDGSSHGSGVTTSHAYSPSGIYIVTLTVTDNDGLTGTDTLVLYISNSIQDLIDAASPGATVYVPADHYWERIIIDKPLTLIGADKNTTIIDGMGLYGDEGPTVTIKASNINLQGFTIINGSRGVYAPECYPSGYNHLTITDNIIESNKDHGIHLRTSSNNVISNNIIRLNMRYTWSGRGITIESDYGLISRDNTITNNIIESNGRHGIYIYSIAIDHYASPTYNTISGNTIMNHTYYEIYIYRASYNLVENNNISGRNSNAIFFQGSNNTINYNNIWDSGYGIRMGDSGSHSNDNLICNNTFTNNSHALIIYDDGRLEIDNIIRFNTFAYNYYGVTIDYPVERCGDLASRNKIYLNNFIDNTMQGYDGGYDNRWDTGNIGNYWSDYLGIDCGGMTYPWDISGKHLIAGDGIGDTLCPHPVDEDDGDYYPIIRLSGWIPIADAGPDQTVDVGDIVIFSGIGSWDLDGWIVNYTWDFGDGSFGYGMNVTHTYSVEGIYNVTLTVTDNDGFTGTDYCNITVLPSNEPPVADANGPYSGYAGIKIIFDAIGSTDPENQPLKYRWDFNNDNIFETDWLINSTTEYTYYNSYTGEILLEVSDGISSDTDTAIVEVEIKSAKQLKEETVESLERAKTGDKKVDKKIDDVIKNIKKSLKDDLWEDEIHLNPKKGNKVFVSERTAIARMELYLNRQELSGDVFEEVIKDLVLADKIIAQVILSEAKSTFVKSEKQQKNFEEMISKAEKEIEQAWEYENSNPAKAVRYYWQSWKYSQGAIQEAEK
ncbi:right-handed parallel beta-helix repeat-containing protein, partial [Candidatus Pacearchaeota archaeon]|nr:right-handed parallel beta-helix repeat-containing protein [Candidatus Pacearchaeota archaeon]